jgi:paraquat-inducible protein A
MSAASHQAACLECDLLLPAPEIEEGERATCPRCGHLLIRHPRDGLVRPLNFAVASVIFLMAALSFPFLSMKAGGLENQMTLIQTARELYDEGQTAVAALVFSFILLIPSILLSLVLALLVPLVRGRNAPWLVATGRAIFTLSSWTMVEVFVIGVIVSLVKLMKMASISLGISFWSYVVFGICLTATLSSLDRAFVWKQIERVMQR